MGRRGSRIKRGTVNDKCEPQLHGVGVEFGNHPRIVGQQEHLRRQTHFNEVDLHLLRGSIISRVFRGSKHPVGDDPQAGQLPACQQQLR